MYSFFIIYILCIPEKDYMKPRSYSIQVLREGSGLTALLSGCDTSPQKRHFLFRPCPLPGGSHFSTTPGSTSPINDLPLHGHLTDSEAFHHSKCIW